MTKPPDKPSSTERDAPTRPRRKYVAPKLVEYGSVRQITMAGGLSRRDFIIFRRRG